MKEKVHKIIIELILYWPTTFEDGAYLRVTQVLKGLTNKKQTWSQILG